MCPITIMRTSKQIISLILVLCCVVLTLASCGNPTQKIQVGELKMKLGEQYHIADKINMKEFEAVYVSDKTWIYFTKESFTPNSKLATTSSREYADLSIAANEIKNADIREENGICYYVYSTGDVSSIDHKFAVVVVKSDNAFWLVQYCAKLKNFDSYLEDFLSNAKTIRF